MSSLPPPPPTGPGLAPPQALDPAVQAPPHPAGSARPPRPGELTGAWRTTTVVVWVGVVLVPASVWRSSRTLGLSTWWLGPPAEPRLFLVQLLPFYGPLLMIVLASRPMRFVPLVGLGVSAVLAGVAAVDLGRFSRLGWVELAAALAGASISVASFAGRYRRA